MELKDLEHKEAVLRECFKEKLDMLNVNGTNNMCTIDCIKTYGVLWHTTHQLLLAERKEHEAAEQDAGNITTAETMDIRATGLKMAGGTK